MSSRTTNFNLIKPAETDPAAISQLNDDLDAIDAEMAKPPLTVNDVEPGADRNIRITNVALADNLTSDEAQINEGTYILRTSGGEASIADGSAWLNEIIGNMVKTGYVPESINMTVNGDDIEATLDRDTFVEAVSSSGTITLTYTTAWSADPATYGITVDGTPTNGDSIVIVYVKENRGQITTALPMSFISVGWNLYNHSAGYARVVNYSEDYGFMIEGTYTSLKFAETLSGEQITITPVNGYFVLPAGAESGYIFVTGGNNTDTAIWMTWSDWTEEANGGVWEAYTQSTIDLSEIMVLFPYGLMRIGNVYDEINLNTQRAYSRIDKIEYTAQNLEDVISSGVPYDTDTGYIYYVKESPATYTINVNGEYAVSDHGTEMFSGTSVPVTASSLYGQDLKGKLRRDVLTISQQTLTDAQKLQVLQNIGAANASVVSNIAGKVNTYTKYDGTAIGTAKNGATINNNGAYSRAIKRSGWVFLKLRIECPSISSGNSLVVAQLINDLKIAEGIYYYKVYNEWSASITGSMNIRETGEIEARDDCSGKDLTLVISYPTAIE